ncbi:hypothetical protein ACROYT_G035227 [Oculina patagonica]
MEYSSEQLNYFRICYIAFNLVPEGLRKIFRQEWDFRYKTTLGEWKDTPKNGLDFYNNESRKSRSRNARYLATIQNGNTAEWDCSCLFYAILFSDSIGTTLSAAIRTEVDFLRQIRSDIAHISEAELSDAEFKNYVGRVLPAFNSLRLPVNDIEAVKNQTSFSLAEVNNLKFQAANLLSKLTQSQSDLQVAHDTIQSKGEGLAHEINSKIESFCHLTFKPCHEIIRRSNDVKDYDKNARASREVVMVQSVPFIFLEIPGVEKLKLHDKLEKRGFPNYCWTNFMETIGRGDHEATEKPLAEGNPANSNTMTTAITMAINSALESDVVLRQTLFFLSLCASESLPVEAAVNFVKTRTLGETEELIRAKILKFSLISCSYSEDGIPDYLGVHHVIHKAVKKMLTLDFDFTEKTECMSVTIQIFHSLTMSVRNRVNESGLICVMLRRITAHCKALHDILYQDFATKDVLVKKLTSFISADKVVSWLYLTASVCCDLSNSTNATLFSAAACDFFQYMSNTREGDKILKANILAVYGTALSMSRQYELAVSYHEKALVIRKKIYGEEHADVAASYNNLGAVYHDLGHYNKAKEYYDKGLFISKKIYGEKNAVVAASYNNLGNVYCDFAQYNEAKENYDKGLFINKTINGEKHADVAASYNNLGLVYVNLGQYNGAKEYHEKGLVIRKKIYDEEHADVATSYNNLGDVYRHLGLYNEGKAFLEKALAIRKKIYGEEHADVAGSYYNFGLVYVNLGQYNKAKEYHEKGLTIRKKIYGEEHADVATSYDSLGEVYQDLGQYNQAKEYHEKALVIRKKIYGEEHAAVATSYDNLGDHYRLLGQYNEAKEYHEKEMVIWKKIYGEEHAAVAKSYYNLGFVYHDLGQYNEAKECHEKALVIRKKIYGEEHAAVAANYDNLGDVYRHLGQYNEAKEYHEKGLFVKKRIYGEEHASVATSYNNLGLVYQDLEQYNEAKEYHEKALVIRKKIYGEEHAAVAYNEAQKYHKKGLVIRKNIYGEEHADVATSYNSLGNVYSDLGQYNEAKEYYEKAQVIFKKINGEKHTYVAVSYNNLGAVYRGLGQYNEAKEYHEKALVIRKKIYGEEHADVAASYNNLGLVYQDLGQYNEAKEYHEKALVIRKKIYGEEHADVAASYTNLGIVYDDLWQYNEAKEYFEKALAIRKKIYGEEHPRVAQSRRNLEIVDSHLRRRNQWGRVVFCYKKFITRA